MPSECENFWGAGSYAVVGHQSSKKPYPKITYGALKERGATVYPMDPDGGTVEGDAAYADFSALPGPVDAAVLELPKEETAAWVAKAADAGVKQIWIHQMTDTPEALAEAEKRGLKVISGHCAVMYNKPGMSMHAPPQGDEGQDIVSGGVARCLAGRIATMMRIRIGKKMQRMIHRARLRSLRSTIRQTSQRQITQMTNQIVAPTTQLM
jgi:hypothetical protein